MVDKELTMTSDEVLDYIKNNFKEFDKVDIAYNRVSAKGDVLGVDLSDYRGKPSCRVMIALDGEIISDTIEVDFEEYKEDIIELHHYPKDESKESVYIEVIWLLLLSSFFNFFYLLFILGMLMKRYD